jgi:hypothetical protein
MGRTCHGRRVVDQSPETMERTSSQMHPDGIETPAQSSKRLFRSAEAPAAVIRDRNEPKKGGLEEKECILFSPISSAASCIHYPFRLPDHAGPVGVLVFSSQRTQILFRAPFVTLCLRPPSCQNLAIRGHTRYEQNIVFDGIHYKYT